MGHHPPGVQCWPGRGQVEIMAHWYAGRSYTQVARSLGIDRGTVVKYTAPGPGRGHGAWRRPDK